MKIYHGTVKYQREHDNYTSYSDLLDRDISISDLKKMIATASSAIISAINESTDPNDIVLMSGVLNECCNELRILTNSFNYDHDTMRQIPFGV